MTSTDVIANPDNAFRHRGQPRWFDFYNCRVMLPEEGRFFFLMPYMLSGEAVSPERTGLYVLDGGNGGPTRRIQTGIERVGPDGWSAAEEGCGLSWASKGMQSVVTETAIQAVSPHGRWDVLIEPFISDRAEPVGDLRRFELEERLILRRVPFIHRVPVMKGYASGRIEWDGEEYRFDRALVYQAKNHGPTLPERWTWIHANAFAEDEELTFEVASNPTSDGAAAMVRIVRPDAHQSLTTWEGATIHLDRT
ncbi:MAG: tocopherol cyclase family protein, partial [Rubricoccaceae bacterium]|nr:tocopherol cyclase family protein [Rubricoccaceae bacterium]